MAALLKQLEALRNLAGSGSLSQERVNELAVLIQQKSDELRKTVDLTKAGRVENALEVVRTGQGKGLMDSIRSAITAIESQQSDDRAAAKRSADSAINLRGLVFLVSALINLVFLLWAYRRIHKEIRQQYVANLETRRQKEILGITLSSIGDAVIITDLKGRVTFLNLVAEELTGWSASEAFERPCVEIFRIINEETRQPVESPVDNVLNSGAICGLANHTLLIRKDGSEVPIDDSGAPIREADGTVRGVVLVFRDFTAHKNFQRMLIAAKEEVEASNAAKDKFLATLSHELRAPLTPVLATLSSWEATRQLPLSLRPDLQLIRRNIELEARLIDDLLDVTRIDNGKLSLKKETVDLNSIVDSTIALFRSESQTRQLKLNFTAGAEHHFLKADPARLQQIFLNIIGNAVKFTPDGGKIEIFSTNPNDQLLEVTVADSGIGMSEKTKARVFQRFEQGEVEPEKSLPGLGLGLPIAKALAEAHGGALVAASKGPGLGSSFTVTFPVLNTPAAVAERKLLQPRGKAQVKLRLLLLEDHEDTAQVMGNLLRLMGHQVEICSTVAAALENVRTEQYDMILSDIGLRDGSGLDFIRKVRETTQAPAVALTGYGTTEDVRECLQAGFDEHLIKPVDIERLRQTLEKLSRKRAGASI